MPLYVQGSCGLKQFYFDLIGFGDREKELFYESDKILDFEEDWKELFRRERSLRAVEGQVKSKKFL